MLDYAILFAVIFGINLLPAFGPPTWTIIVMYGLRSHMFLPAVVLVGAIAAALGRLLLALGFRYLRRHVPERMKRNLEAAGSAVEQHGRGSLVAIGLFALSPMPSAQLFEAAGLMGVRLIRFTASFFAGRVVSYSIYGATAKGVEGTPAGAALHHALAGRWGVVLEIALILLLLLAAQINWAKLLGQDQPKDP